MRALGAGVMGFKVLSYSGGSVLHSGSSWWFDDFSVSCLLVIIHLCIWAIKMSSRDLLTGLHSFLPSCLCYQPRDSLIADIRSFPLGNPKDGSHAFHISLNAASLLHQIGKSGREGDVTLLLELGSCE